MGNHLNCSPEIVAASFLGNDRIIDLAGGKVIVVAKPCMGKPLVVTQVEIGFGAVIGDKHLTMLKGIHGAGINIQVGIQFLDGDGEASTLQERPHGS